MNDKEKQAYEEGLNGICWDETTTQSDESTSESALHDAHQDGVYERTKNNPENQPDAKP